MVHKTTALLKTKDGSTLWAARCDICGEIECCPNGTFSEAAAKIHVVNNPGHEVIVGNIYSA